MPKRVEPRAFLIGETRMEADGFQEMLTELGASGWTTDAHSDAEKLIEAAGKLCYMSFNADLNKNLTRVRENDNAGYIGNMVAQQHFSVIEHGSVTFAFLNVSRVFTHELVRHRHGSYSQVSGRYVRSDQISYWLPSCFRGNAKAEGEIERAFAAQEETAKTLEALYGIDTMKDFSLKKMLTSAFRRITGNGQANHIIATYNHRSLREILEKRTSVHAEEEIRVVFNQVARLLVKRYPAIYRDAQFTYDDPNNLDDPYRLFSVTFGH